MRRIINLLKKSKTLNVFVARCYNLLFNCGRGMSSNVKNGGGIYEMLNFA